MSFLRNHCRRGNFSVDSTGFRRVRAAGNSPVHLTPATQTLYCIMAICKERPDIKGGELRFNSKVLWATMVAMFAWMLILLICQVVAN